MSSNTNMDFFKISKKGKRLPPPIAVAHETLLAKSKLMAKRSVDATYRTLLRHTFDAPCMRS